MLATRARRRFAPQVEALLDSEPPVAVHALWRLARADPADLELVCSAIESCPPLVARLLAVFRSPAFATRQVITSIKHAVVMLGGRNARAIAMCHALKLLYREDRASRQLVDLHWRCSLAKAEAARTVAESIDGGDPDAALTAALLQDLAMACLITIDPQFYADLCRRPLHPKRWLHRERDRFGVDHVDLNVALLEHWNIGEHWVEQLRDHHRGLHDADRTATALPRVTAAALPHLDEPLHDGCLQWLTAIHARFLYERFNTPEAFLVAVEVAVSTFIGEPPPESQDPKAQLYHDLCEQVTQSMIHLSTNIADMETVFDNHRQDFTTLRTAAFSDTLTRVLNRRGFLLLGERRLADIRARGVGCALLFIDMNGFKQVNDNLGHDAGDRLLRGMAKLLRRSVDRQDMIGRLGGDEFAVLISDVTCDEAVSIAQRVQQVCDATKIKVADDAEPVRPRFAQGLCHAERLDRHTSLDALIKLADQSMYAAKQSARPGPAIVHYEPSDELKGDPDASRGELNSE